MKSPLHFNAVLSLKCLLCGLWMMGGGGEAVHGAVTLTGTTYSETFTIGTSATASLPTDWKMTAAGDTTVSWSDGTNVTATTQAVSSGSPTAGGRYNWGNGGDATDRAIGFMTSGSYAEPNSILANYQNNTGSTITDINFSFDLERYRRNTAGLTVNFYFSTDGATWGTALDSYAWGTGASAYDFTPTAGEGSEQARTATLGSLSIADGSQFYVRWEFDGTASSNGQGVGLDDFGMTLTLAALATELYWLGDDTTRGGPGTWSTIAGNWSATDADGGPAIVFDKTKTAVFGGATGGTVTVSGTVEADKGITFNTTGYTVTGGTAIEMNGATAAINTITTGSGVTATIATDITGSTGVTKASAGTLVFTGAKSYTGGTTISGGTLQLGDGTTNGSVNGAVTNNATLAFNNGVDQTFANDVSGTGALTKTGAGVLTLTGTNTYAGKTTITGGFIAASGESKFGTNPATFTADQITLNGGGIQSNGNIDFNSNRGLTLGAGGGTFKAVGTDQITLTNVVTGSGALTKTGSGDLNVDGANTFTGGLVINEGRVKLGNAGALNASAPNAVTFGANAAATAVLELNGNRITVAGLNTNATPGTPVVENANGTSATLTVNNATANTYAGTIQNGTGAGTLALNKTSAGALTLSGNNTYSGGTTINAGSVVAASNTALGGAGVTMTGGSLLATSGVTLSNDITVSAAATGALLITQYYEGPSTNKWIEITNISASSIDLAAGGYRLGLFGNANAEDYKTDLAPANNVALTGTLTAGQSLLLGNTGNTTPGYADVYSPLTDSNSVINFNGNDSIVLYTTPTFSTANILDAIGFTTAGNEGVDKSFVRATTGTGYNTTAGSDVLDFGSIWTQVTNATVDGAAVSTDNRLGYSSLTGGSAATVTIGSQVAGSATFSGQMTLNSDVTLTAAASGTVTFSGKLTGASGNDVTKTGDGIVILNNNTNDYAGSTTVSAGTLEVNNTTGSATGTGTVTVQAGAKLQGTGTITGLTTIQGAAFYEAGTASTVGTLNFTAATVENGSQGNFQLTANGVNDRLNVTGSGQFTVGTTAAFKVFLDYTPTATDFFDLLDWVNAIGGDTNIADNLIFDLGDETPGAGLVWDTSTFNTDGVLRIAAVPEPSRVLLLAAGMAGLLLRRRRVAAFPLAGFNSSNHQPKVMQAGWLVASSW